MKRYRQAIWVLAFLLPCLGHWAFAQNDAGPRMVLEEEIYDFNEVMEGEVVEHTFKVLNKGEAPLEITRVSPGWGCTVAHYDRVIPPGGEGTIKLTVKTKGSQGPIQKNARVYSSDPAHRAAILKIKGLVKVAIHLSPRKVYLSGFEGQSVTKVVNVRAELDKPLSLTPNGFSLSEKVEYSLEEIEPGKTFQIRLTTIPGPPGSYSGFLKLNTNYPEKPQIYLPIRGQFRKKG